MIAISYNISPQKPVFISRWKCRLGANKEKNQFVGQINQSNPFFTLCRKTFDYSTFLISILLCLRMFFSFPSFVQFCFLSLYLRLLYPAALNTLSTFQNISPLAITNIFFFASLVYHRLRLFLTPDDFRNSKLSSSHIVPFPTIVFFFFFYFF